MSRSLKAPYVTDQQNSRTEWKKRKAARRIRSLPEVEAPANGKAYRKEYNPWNIRDWSMRAEDPKKPWKARRK